MSDPNEVKDKKHNYQVWYIISQNKIILEMDGWSKVLFDDADYFYVGQFLNGEDYYDKKLVN